MPKGAGIKLDNHSYNLVQDHETYIVTDVPSHPDSDGRMERRVRYDRWLKGILKRRESDGADASTYSINYVNRIEKAGEGMWMAWGGDSRMEDRIFGQRLASTSVTLASKPLFFGDASVYSYVACQQHMYSVSGVTGGVQQLTLAKDFSGIAPAVNIVDVAAFNGAIYVATCQLTNGVPDPSKAQPFWVWDQASTTTNWANPPTALNAPTWPASSPIVVNGTPATYSYQYYVIATSASASSGPSYIQSVTTGPATLTGVNSITLNWNAVGGATGYTVYRVKSGGTPSTTGVIVTGVAGTTYTDTGAAVTSLLKTTTPQFALDDTQKATAFCVLNNVLWRANGAKLYSWDGQQGTWSGQTLVGDPSTPVTALDVYEQGLIAFKTDGIYTVDKQGTVFPLFPGFRTLGFNTRPLGQWRNNYYFAADVGLVWEWDGTVVNSIGFDNAEAAPMPDGTFGLLNAATRGVSLPNMLVVGFNKWNDNVNSAGFFLAWDGKAWHPYRFDPNYNVSGLGLTGNNSVPSSPTLQFGETKANNSSQALFFITQPTLDPVLSTTFDTITQTIYLPVDQGIIHDEWKVLEGVRVYIQNPTAGVITVSYATDSQIDTLTYTDMGRPTGDKQSVQTFTPLAPLPSYRQLAVKVTITPTTTAATPVLRNIVTRYKQRTTQRKSWDMQLLLEEGQMNPSRSREANSPRQMLANLNDARVNKRLVEFIDLVGDTYQVYVESVGEKLVAYRGTNFNPTFAAKVVLVQPVEYN